jgi:mannose-6-phosphate isomerase-like protein (cupin superfamily)
VLEGEATFHFDGEDNTRVLGLPSGREPAPRVLKPHEGIMLPKGTFYRFESTGQQNLVMLRVGAAPPGSPKQAVYPEGGDKSRDQEPYARMQRIEASGRQFGEVR